MTRHFHLNDEQTSMTVTLQFDVPIIKNGETLTAAQYEALKEYCTRYVAGYIDRQYFTSPITINACSVFRKNSGGGKRDQMFFDADTGELYDEKRIYDQVKDGQYEIRIKSTNGPQTA